MVVLDSPGFISLGLAPVLGPATVISVSYQDLITKLLQSVPLGARVPPPQQLKVKTCCLKSVCKMCHWNRSDSWFFDASRVI